MNVECAIDLRGLQNGVRHAAIFTRRAPDQVVNTAGYFISIDAQSRMPFTAISTIDIELNAFKAPVIGVRGKPLKGKNKYVSLPGTAKNPEVALAVLIIQARGRYGSKYNELTNYKYALFGSPFKGVSRAEGRALMAQLVHQMIASRHSATHFLQMGWSPVIDGLRTYAVTKYARGSPRRSSGIRNYSPDLGEAIPAQTGSTTATCTIENKIGEEGLNAESFDKALQLYGAPALQQAIDNEGVKQMKYFLDKMAQAELVVPFNRAAG